MTHKIRIEIMKQLGTQHNQTSQHTLSKIVKTICQADSPEGYFTNHLLRASAASQLYNTADSGNNRVKANCCPRIQENK